MIGMHLKRVAVPVRVAQKKVGEADILIARTRLPPIGGKRAEYPEDPGKRHTPAGDTERCLFEINAPKGQFIFRRSQADTFKHQ